MNGTIQSRVRKISSLEYTSFSLRIFSGMVNVYKSSHRNTLRSMRCLKYNNTDVNKKRAKHAIKKKWEE